MHIRHRQQYVHILKVDRYTKFVLHIAKNDGCYFNCIALTSPPTNNTGSIAFLSALQPVITLNIYSYFSLHYRLSDANIFCQETPNQTSVYALLYMGVTLEVL